VTGGWRDPDPSIEHLLRKYAPEVFEGGTNGATPPPDRGSLTNLERTLRGILREMRRFNRNTEECD